MHERHDAGHSQHALLSEKNDSAHLSVLFDEMSCSVSPFSTHAQSTRTKSSLHNRHESGWHRSNLSWQSTREVNSALFHTRHSTHTAKSFTHSVKGTHNSSTRTAFWQTNDVGTARSAAMCQYWCDSQGQSQRRGVCFDLDSCNNNGEDGVQCRDKREAIVSLSLMKRQPIPRACCKKDVDRSMERDNDVSCLFGEVWDVRLESKRPV